jgi:hypothetical protein
LLAGAGRPDGALREARLAYLRDPNFDIAKLIEARLTGLASNRKLNGSTRKPRLSHFPSSRPASKAPLSPPPAWPTRSDGVLPLCHALPAQSVNEAFATCKAWQPEDLSHRDVPFIARPIDRC